MAREYEIAVCTGCGGMFPGGCTCEPSHAKTGKIVTAIDIRDVSELAQEFERDARVIKTEEDSYNEGYADALLAASEAIGSILKTEEGEEQ